MRVRDDYFHFWVNYPFKNLRMNFTRQKNSNKIEKKEIEISKINTIKYLQLAYELNMPDRKEYTKLLFRPMLTFTTNSVKVSCIPNKSIHFAATVVHVIIRQFC